MPRTLTKRLSLGRLRLNGDTQPREKLDPVTVASYASDLEAGAKLPPVDAFWDGSQYWLADGFHRHDAHREAGQDLITCKVHAGTVEDARWFALAANKIHGLRRTNADKARAVKRALIHPNGAKMSDGKIAEYVGVHVDTVVKYRREVKSDLPKTGKLTDERTGRDGRTINTSNIGAKPSVAERPSQPVDMKTARPDGEPTEADVEAVDHDAWPCPECGMEDWDAASETCRVCTKIDAANKQAADSGEKPGPLQGVTRKLADLVAAARATLTPQQLAIVAELLRDMSAELEE